jgi:hypothetical protein
MKLIINCLIFFSRKKDNFVNILDYYNIENKEDADTDSDNVEEYIYVLSPTEEFLLVLVFRTILMNK